MLWDEGAPLRRVLVCAPGAAYREPGALAAHNLTARADAVQAALQHAALRAALTTFGAEVTLLDELPGHPNSVFVQDPALMTSEGYVRLRMGLPTRRGEEAWLAEALAALGLPEIGRIEAPGTVEGGDVILAGEVAFVGRSSRTNAEGCAQLAALLRALGHEVRIADVPPPSLHIGGMMSVVAHRQVVAAAGIFPEGFFDGFDVLSVPCTDFISGNVITLGPGEVMVGAHAQTTASVLHRAGLRVHRLELSEFVKGTGGPSCLVLPVAREA